MTMDTNNIKLFVGQVPSTWQESDLRPVMEVFGQISDIVILTDKMNGRSKGKYENCLTWLVDSDREVLAGKMVFKFNYYIERI